jgi:hypothetical protein
MKLTSKQPTPPSNASKDRGRKRALARIGSRSDHKPPLARLSERLTDGTMCERCGAVYSRRHWRPGTEAERAMAQGFFWDVCPACRQVESGEYYGSVTIRGARALREEDALRRRIENVGARARYTSPERRIVAIDRRDDVIEVLATSQKLAHRIVNALLAAFGGRGTYSWSDRDGALRATWTWEDETAPRKAQSPRRPYRPGPVQSLRRRRRARP